ncbi:MAG: hypothetical protein ACTSQG_00255 [Promethearchaeota archaeon]
MTTVIEKVEKVTERFGLFKCGHCQKVMCREYYNYCPSCGFGIEKDN